MSSALPRPTTPHCPPGAVDAAGQGVVPRILLAALLTPVLGYWAPTRAFQALVEADPFGGIVATVYFYVGSILVGSYLAIVLALRVRRAPGTPAYVAPIEELLAALLAVVAMNAPVWFGLNPSDSMLQPLAIQACTVFLALMVLSGVFETHRLPPIMVGSIRPDRELTVRAMVAALMPTAILYAILPAMVATSAIEAALGGDVNIERRILIAWTSATLAGISIAMAAWRGNKPAYLDKPEQIVITLAAMGMAVGAWTVFGGLEGPAAAFLFQPAAIFAATVVLGSRRAAADAAFFGTRSAAAGLDEPLLVPPGGGISLGVKESRHRDAAGDREELRIEARWLVPRPMNLVAGEYRLRNGLVTKTETESDLLLTRGAPYPASVRIVGRAVQPSGLDASPPRSRTEVTVRLVRPD